MFTLSFCIQLIGEAKGIHCLHDRRLITLPNLTAFELDMNRKTVTDGWATGGRPCGHDPFREGSEEHGFVFVRQGLQADGSFRSTASNLTADLKHRFRSCDHAIRTLPVEQRLKRPSSDLAPIQPLEHGQYVAIWPSIASRDKPCNTHLSLSIARGHTRQLSR
jgi:hypothetical protein